MSWVSPKRPDPFWDRPEDEIWRDLVVPGEDLPLKARGKYYRWFRSLNVIDLVKVRRKRAQPPKADGRRG
jgi:hypothetical protein